MHVIEGASHVRVAVFEREVEQARADEKKARSELEQLEREARWVVDALVEAAKSKDRAMDQIREAYQAWTAARYAVANQGMRG
jgi:hypothetical protein